MKIHSILKYLEKYKKYFSEIITSMWTGDFSVPLNYCVVCRRKTRFIISGLESHSIRCISCKSTAISLSLVSTISEIQLKPNSSVYELSYHGAVHDYLKESFSQFMCSEYFGPSVPQGGYINGIRNEDVQCLSFDDSIFDLVTSTEVFEHVPNYMLGFSEIHRVLRLSGYFIFTVPLYDCDHTENICIINSDGHLQWVREEEYHDSRVTGPGSVPVFWRHSKKQIILDLINSGFRDVKIVESNKYALPITQFVVVAKK